MTTGAPEPTTHLVKRVTRLDMKRHRDIETEVASDVAAWMTAQGWKVYVEVADPWARRKSRAAQCDLVGVREVAAGVPETFCVEVKMSLSLEVYAQAFRWTNRSTYVAVAVAGGEQKRYIDIVRHMAQTAGIGLLAVRASDIVEIAEPRIRGASSEAVFMLARAARNSSVGWIAQAGRRSPPKIKPADLEAEAVKRALDASGVRQLSLSAILEPATPDTLRRVAYIINAKRGRALGLMARKFGSDYLISYR
jgi:hypothetical protein